MNRTHVVPRRAVSSTPSITSSITSNDASINCTTESKQSSWTYLDTRTASDQALYPYILRMAVAFYRNEPKFRTRADSSGQSPLKTSMSHSSFQDTLAMITSNGANLSGPSPPSFGNAKLPRELPKLLQHRFKGIALKPEKYPIKDNLLKRSYMAFYAIILSPDSIKQIKESRSAEQLIMKFLSCAAKELNRAVPEKSQVPALIDQQAAAFVYLLISILKKHNLVKECPSLVRQLESYGEALTSSSDAALEPQMNADHISSAVVPTFELKDMDMCKIIGQLLLIADSEIQRDIMDVKEKATVGLLVQELKTLETYLTDYNKHSVYKQVDFASSDLFDDWKKSELAAIRSTIASYTKSLGDTSPDPLQPAADIDYRQLFFIPDEPIIYYKLLIRRCLERDLHLADKEMVQIPNSATILISKVSRDILSKVSTVWRIPSTTRGVLFLQVAVEMYEAGAIELSTLTDAFNVVRILATDNHKLEWAPDAWSTCDKSLFHAVLSSVHDLIIDKIGSCLSHIFDSSYPKIGPYLQILDESVYPSAADLQDTSVMEPSSRQINKLRQILLQAAEQKYDTLIDDIPRDHTLDPLHVIDLADKLIGIAKKLQKRYSMALFDVISIGHVCTERHLNLFSADSKSMFAHLLNHMRARNETPPFEDMILLYKKLTEVRDLFLQVSSNQDFGFKLEDSFRPFVYEWAETSAELALKWVEPAISADNFLPVDEENDRMHSSSVNDIVASFKSALNMVSELDWRNEFDKGKFLTILMKGISAAICHYTSEIFQLFSNELETPDQDQSRIRSRQEKWLLMAKNAVNGGEKIIPYKFMKETCVKLNDIERIQIELDKMEGDVKSEKVAQLIEKVQPAFKASSYLFTIKIIQAEELKACDMNGLSDPYVTVVDQMTRKTIGKTRTIYEELNPSWNETFEVATNGPKWLTATVWDENSMSNHDVCGRAFIRLDPNAFEDFGAQDYWMELDTQGRILINISMDSEKDDIRFHFGKAFRTLMRTESDMIRMIVEKFTAFILYSISLQTLKALRGNRFSMETVSNWLNSARLSSTGVSPQKRLTADEIDDSLNPLFDYLNDNFAIVARGLTEELKIKVMTQTWKVVLQQVENIMLPALSAKRTTQQQLSSTEVEIVFIWLNSLLDFFHHDGAGPSMETLKSERYQLLMTIPVYYDVPTPDLKKESEKMAALSFKSLQEKTKFAVPELIRRSDTVMAHRNRAVVKQQQDQVKHAKRELPQTEDIILRVLRARGEYEYVGRRLKQRERMAQTLATENIVKQAAGVHLKRT